MNLTKKKIDQVVTWSSVNDSHTYTDKELMQFVSMQEGPAMQVQTTPILLVVEVQRNKLCFLQFDEIL